MAERFPQKDAIILCASGRKLTFQELDQESDRYAHGFDAIGIRRDTSVALLVPPGSEFFTLAFALFKVGAVMVLIDPGMGLKNMLRCLGEIKPQAFIGVPAALALKTLTRTLPTAKIKVTVGPRIFWGGHRLKKLRSRNSERYEMAAARANDPAAVLFTTGSTGLAKGALYRHGMFDAQVRTLQKQYGIGSDEIDLPTFPLFALFDPALGMTAIIPDMDPRKPALVRPENIIGPVQKYKVTHMFGSPALLARVAKYGEAKGVKLPSLRRVISAGAPVPSPVLASFASMLSPGVEIHTPYGATEALPVATIGSTEIIEHTGAETQKGAGTCVGRPAGEIDIRIIGISDDAIETWSPELVVAPGAVGEIVVRGPVVTREYFAREEATKMAKIAGEGGQVWHRMGDVGRFDESGRLWFFGRKAHRVVTETGTLFSDPCEGIMNTHPKVFRSALVGVGLPGKQRAVMCIELRPGGRREQLDGELRQLARSNPVTSQIDTFLVHPKFPVDIRHNAKIFREKLAIWAAQRLS
ncbi:MAG: AMP-binding protein [Deltaproteobacteria bacterium]|nr:AMP-binding protein [Deltaproteobacteria bacterium]